MTWTEVDDAGTSATETDFVFGPVTTSTSLQGRVLAQLDNLSSLSPHYALLPSYFNQAKDELLTLGMSINRSVLDQLPRLRNWRWWDVTTANLNYLPLPERMLWLDDAAYTKLLTAFDPSTTVTYPMSPATGSASDFGVLPRTTTGYPTLFHRAGGRIEFWPTPSSTPTDYRTVIVVYGTRMDKDLSAATDTLLMSPRMQMLAVDLAAVIAMEKMGWDEATERRAALESKLGRLISPGAQERARAPINTQVAGTPR